MQAIAKARLQIHFCVVLWGFTAILGKLITLPASALVWWRMLLVTLALLATPRVWRGLRAMPARLRWAYAGIGVLVSLHWLTFYAAIKLSNASVGATCIALGPVFLAFVEPWIARRRFDPRELLLGVAVVPGVALVVGGVPTAMRLGLVVGTASALLVALFSACNKRLVEHGDPLTVTAWSWAPARCSSACWCRGCRMPGRRSCCRARTMRSCWCCCPLAARCCRSRWRWSRCAT